MIEQSIPFPKLLKLVLDVGDQIQDLYQCYLRDNRLKINTKIDKTPVTEADLLAHQQLVLGLKTLTPDLSVLSEESAEMDLAQQTENYWLVDPLDGTRDFLEGTNDFTINVALIKGDRPVLGIVYAPALQLCYYANLDGAFKQAGKTIAQLIRTRAINLENVNLVISRHHESANLDRFLNQFVHYSLLRRGSALKFGLVAEGVADLYLRFSPTSKWDTAAGQCILERAGGKVIDLQGQPLQYSKQGPLINPHFLAIADSVYDWQKYF